MAKYLILFNAAESAREQMANATPEQMQASMGEWMKWKDEVAKTVKFEWGMPIQAVSHITASGMEASANPASGYCTMESDSKEEILKLLQSHPHLKRAQSSIDVLEMIPMPGM